MQPAPLELRGAMAALWDCRDREVLVEGRAGTSKTTGICKLFVHRCRAYPGSRHLICRLTRESITQSVAVTLERVIGETHPEVVRVKREQRHSYRLYGSEIVLGGLDKPSKLFSTEWDTVYLAEAIECDLEPWELFGRAMRNNRTPFPQRIADTNPGPPRHWLNMRATPCPDELRDTPTPERYNALQRYNFGHQDGVMRRLVSVHADNPAYWDLERWEWTPTGREYVTRTLAMMTGHRRARMFDGRWRAADGVVFPEFDESRHVMAPFAIPPDWPVYWGYDPGYDHPTAILWFTISPNNTLYIIDEIYGGGRSIEQLAAAVRERETAARYVVQGRYADPQMAFSRTAYSPVPIAQQWAKVGFRMSPWRRTGDQEETMVEAVRLRLINQSIKVFATCQATIGEFQSWSYARDAKGQLPAGKDKFEDRSNHAMDVTKGIVSLNLQHERGRIRAVEEPVSPASSRRSNRGRAGRQ